jgi:hypothetical protein
MPKNCYAFDSQAKQFLAPGRLMQQHVESSFRHTDRSCTICMSASLFYHVRRRWSHIPEALPPTQCYNYTTTSPGRNASMPKARHLAKTLWVSQSGLPILYQFKNSSHTDRILGGTLLYRKNITARLHPFPSMLPHYPKL